MTSEDAARRIAAAACEASGLSMSVEGRSYLWWWCSEGRNHAGERREDIVAKASSLLRDLCAIIRTVPAVGDQLRASVAIVDAVGSGNKDLTDASMRALEATLSVSRTRLCNYRPKADTLWLAEDWIEKAKAW